MSQTLPYTSFLENYQNIGPDLIRAEMQQGMSDYSYGKRLTMSSKQNRKDYAFQLANALSYERLGAEKAGFSPLAALGQHGSFSPASGSAPSVDMSNRAVGGDDKLIQLMSLQKTLDNLDSNTRKNNADAQGQETKNMEEDDKNATASANYQRFLTSLQEKYKDDPQKLEQIKLLGDPQTVYSSGSLQAQRDFISLLGEMSDFDKKKAENEFTQLLNRQLIQDKRYKQISEKYDLDNQASKQHLYEVAQKIVNMRLEALKIAQDTSTSESQKRLNEASIDKIAAEIQNTLANADKTYHSDYASMWHNKDFQSMIISLAAEATRAAAAAAGFGAASRVAGKIGTPKTDALKQRLDKAFEQSKRDLSAKQWAANRAAFNKKLGDEFKANAPKPERKRMPRKRNTVLPF